MKIYVDTKTFHCHIINPDGTFLEHETTFFDGKCGTFIEGHRCVLPGKSWTRFDDKVFRGEMIAPWKDYAELDAAQR